jgi:hypothetical protein
MKIYLVRTGFIGKLKTKIKKTVCESKQTLLLSLIQHFVLINVIEFKIKNEHNRIGS